MTAGEHPQAAIVADAPGGVDRRARPETRTGPGRSRATVSTDLWGRRLLNEPELNKGTAFSEEERAALGLHGLLPPRVESVDEQIAATLDRYESFNDDLQRHVFLRALEDTNEVLFYAFLDRHFTDLLPIIYTPTVGRACKRFSHIYRRPHGLFLSYPNRHLLDQQLASIAGDIDVIVATDGERILGLGDQGLGGMSIPIGKLALYTAAGGIDPRRSLPVLLDVGTNNQALLADPMYLGWRHERITGTDYDRFIDDVVAAIRRRFPSVLLQWEDFGGHHARTLLDRYRRRILSFNDDIQGTAAVTLATVLAAVGRSGRPLAEHRICIAGAGAAGCGIADMLADAFRRAGEDELGARLFLTDVEGLVHDGRTDLTVNQRPYATPASVRARWAEEARLDDLGSVLEQVDPTVLIGVSGQGGLFTEAIVRRMAERTERPIILPLSNPTRTAEAHPAVVLRWTDGRAIVATGSPFGEVTHDGAVHPIPQANNVYIFPGLGLGALVAEASHVSDRMLLAAAETLVTEASRHGNALLPPLGAMKQTSRRIAVAVARAAFDEGIARSTDDRDLDVLVDERFYEAVYRPIEPVSGGGGTG